MKMLICWAENIVCWTSEIIGCAHRQNVVKSLLDSRNFDMEICRLPQTCLYLSIRGGTFRESI